MSKKCVICEKVYTDENRNIYLDICEDCLDKEVELRRTKDEKEASRNPGKESQEA